MSDTTAPCSTSTCAVRAGIESDTQHGAVVPPLHLSTNYAFEGLGGKRAYDYSRSGNPTRDLLGNALAELEQGAGAVVNPAIYGKCLPRTSLSRVRGSITCATCRWFCRGIS